MSGHNSKENKTKHRRPKCHRCESNLKTLNGHQYCQGCNWDSLTDVIDPKNDQVNISKKQGFKYENEN